MKKITCLAIVAACALPLTSCGDSDGGDGEASQVETWEGQALQEYEIAIGTWSGSSGLVKVECSGDEEAPTAVLTAPEGFSATTTMPEGGGRSEVKVEGPDDREVVWDEDGLPNTVPYGDGPYEEDALRWGPNVTFTTPGDSLVEDTESDYVVDLAGVEFSCARGD